MWVDLDGGAPATGFQVNWIDITPTVNDTRIGQKAHDMCQTPSFYICKWIDNLTAKLRLNSFGGSTIESQDWCLLLKIAPSAKFINAVLH